jgi:hypothetical protein
MGGRIYRPGKTHSGSRVQLGSVSAFASNKRPPQLEMDQLDKIVLLPNADGNYECDLFWEANTLATESSKSDPQTPPQGKKAETEGAKEPAENKPAAVATGSITKDNFSLFLRTLLGGRTTEWKTARTAGDAWVRHSTVIDAIERLEELGWARTRGGYQVPEGDCILMLTVDQTTDSSL